MTEQTISDVDWDEDNVPTIAMPLIEEDIPLPKSATEAFPELSRTEELEMRASTIKLIADLNGDDINPSPMERQQAVEIAKQMAADPSNRPQLAAYSNETIAYLAGLVGQMNAAVVDDLAELKMYVVNKLIYEVEHAKDAKTRVSALTKLGEIDGVDAFKKRTEVTVKQQSLEEVENELLHTLQQLKGRVIDAEVEVLEHKQVGNG